MFTFWRPYFLLLLAHCAASPVQAQIIDLGVPPTGIHSQANAVSGDGKVVVGSAAAAMDTYWLLRWTADGGMASFASFSGLGAVNGVNGDGSVIVGTLSPGGVQRAFRWGADTGLVYLDTLGSISSAAWDISTDGRVIVGEFTDASALRRAFRWTAELGIEDLGGLTAAGASVAYSVSGDGAVAVGTATGSDGSRAVRWQGGTVLDLGVLDGSSASGAFGVNRDGSVVVGASGAYAFRWTAADGMVDLGSMGGIMSAASAVNADGSVVVGYATLADGSDRAFRWTAESGMTSLGLLSGGTYSEATSVSDDGSVIVGKADNAEGERAVIWKSLVLQDLGNLQHSLLNSVDSSAHLMLSQARLSNHIAGQHCIPGAVQRYCLSLGGGMAIGDSAENSRQSMQLMGAGIRLNHYLAVGGNLAAGDTKGPDHAGTSGHDYGLGVWLAYQQNAQTGIGWNATASLSASNGHSLLRRGEHLADVQQAATRVAIGASAQRLALGYGIAVGQTLLTPEVALYHLRSQRQGFEEDNVALPLRVYSARADSTYLTTALRSVTPLSVRGSLHVQLAVETLLHEDAPVFAGHSDIPGLGHFALASRLESRRLTPAITTGYRYALSENASVTGQVQMAASTFVQQSPSYGLGIGFRYTF